MPRMYVSRQARFCNIFDGIHMKSLPLPRAVIFDWDNTLVDTWPLIHRALNATLSEMGKPEWSMEQTKLRVSKSMRDSFPAMFGEDWQAAGERYRKNYRLRHLEELEALPGAAEVLARVHALGLFCVVVSNKLGTSLREEVTHMGWAPYFQAIIGADDAVRDKPHADPVHMAFEKSPVKPGRDVWFIGDSEVDLECAVGTGCTGILYGASAREHPQYSATHFLGFPYDAHVMDHQETLRLFPQPAQAAI